MPVADLYARKSSADAGKSVARQQRAWLADCTEENLTPGRVFVDPDFSASRYATRERPDYAALTAHIKAAQCEVVCLWEVTRGSRQMHEWVSFLDDCRKQGVLIRIFGEDPQTYDPRRQRDRESLLKDGMAAEAEVERMRARTRAGTADAAMQGRPAGPLKDGYKRVYGAPTDNSKSRSGNKRREVIQVIDEPRAQIYRWAAEGLINGVPANFIARVLNAFDVPTATGTSQWYSNAIVHSLLSPTMEGHRVYNGVVVARNAWPAILDPATAARLRAMRATPAPGQAYQDTRLRYLLSGALLCGRCRTPMQGHTRRSEPRDSRRARYECDLRRGGCNRLSGPMGPIDELVSAMVVARLKQPDAMAMFRPADDDGGRVAEAQQLVDVLAARRDELYAEAAKPGGPSMALVAAAERELLPRIEEAQAKLRALQTPPALRNFVPQHLADYWDDYEVGERRAVVLGLAEVVLEPVGKAGRWSPLRLGSSRWVGQSRTWGDVWAASPPSAV